MNSDYIKKIIRVVMILWVFTSHCILNAEEPSQIKLPKSLVSNAWETGCNQVEEGLYATQVWHFAENKNFSIVADIYTDPDCRSKLDTNRTLGSYKVGRTLELEDQARAFAVDFKISGKTKKDLMGLVGEKLHFGVQSPEGVRPEALDLDAGLDPVSN